MQSLSEVVKNIVVRELKKDNLKDETIERIADRVLVTVQRGIDEYKRIDKIVTEGKRQIAEGNRNIQES